MKKDVMITIKGTQLADEEQDSVELTTVGLLYRRNGAYYICYDESAATGFEGAKTTLKVEGDHRVTMRRTGENMRSQLIIEKGERHQCFYDTGYGTLMLGISGDEIIARLNDNGGHLQVRYTLDVNTSTASENELLVDVEEYYPS
ncbi:MAG: DUF1934 domain-containing protein [Oscillospiraceae bacterium]|nr:DUF1934 domain-containing protein [Oscillospiraceae bacterium]